MNVSESKLFLLSSSQLSLSLSLPFALSHSLSLSVCLSRSLSFYHLLFFRLFSSRVSLFCFPLLNLSVYLLFIEFFPIIYLSPSVSVSVSLFFPLFHIPCLCLCLSVCLSVCLSLSLYIYIYIYPTSLHLSRYFSGHYMFDSFSRIYLCHNSEHTCLHSIKESRRDLSDGPLKFTQHCVPIK